MDHTFAQLLAWPSPLPQFHVVVDAPPAAARDWIAANGVNLLLDILTALLGVATVFLGIAALATIVANDVAEQERMRPVCDLEDVSSYMMDQEVYFEFTLANAGGGPAREVQLTLLAYSGIAVNESAYIGVIGANERRRYRSPQRHSPPDELASKPFRLPDKPTGHYGAHDSYVLELRYRWIRDGFGEAYIEDRFQPPRKPLRPRTTLPAIIVRAPKWLLAMIRWIRFALPEGSR